MIAIRSKKALIAFIACVALLLGTLGGVLAGIFHNYYKTQADFPSEKISCMQSLNGDMFIGTYANNAYRYSEQGELLKTFPVSGTVTDIVLTEKHVIVAAENKQVIVFSEDGTQERVIRFDEMVPTFIDVYEDDLFIFLKGNSTEGLLFCYNWKTGEELNSIPIKFSVISGMATTSSGNLLTINSSSEIITYDRNLQEVGERFMTEYAPRFTFRNGNTLNVLDEGNHYYFITENGAELTHSFPRKSTPQALWQGETGGVVFYGGKVFDAYGKKLTSVPTPDFLAECGSNVFIAGQNGLFISDLSLLRQHYGLHVLSIVCWCLFAAAFIGAVVFAIMAFQFLEKALKSSKKTLRKLRRDKFIYIAILPTFLLMAVFGYFPAFYALVLSFCKFMPGEPMVFVQFQNYIDVFQNQYFWGGFLNTALFLVTDLLKAIIPPLIIAELIIALTSKKLQYWARVLLYVPSILPGLASLLIWTNGIFGYDGVVNDILAIFSITPVRWLEHPDTAMLTLLLIGFPWVGNYLIVYGALISVPASLYEAAELDGCVWIKRIFYIDIPMIYAQLKYLFVMAFIASFQNFGTIFMATEGGPDHATNTIGYEMYHQMTNVGNYGNACAIGVLLFILIFAGTLFNMRNSKRQIAY